MLKEKKSEQTFSFRKYAWRQFKKNKPAYVSLYILGTLLLIAAFAPLIANDRPLFIQYKGNILFPAFSLNHNCEIKNEKGQIIETLDFNSINWKSLQYDKVIWAPVPYSPGKSDFLNGNFKSPFDEQKFSGENGTIVPIPARFHHWLGTSQRGDDLLSGLIHGTRISITVGFISMGIAALIGLIIGSLAGFFGDDKLTTTHGKFWTTIFGMIIGWFYGFEARAEILSHALSLSIGIFLLQLMLSIIIFLLFAFLFAFIGTSIGKLPWLKNRLFIPIDSITSRLIEILVSLPVFILIITVAAISKPSILNVMAIIGLTTWTGVARLTRAEMMRIRSQEYIQSAEALGYRQIRIIMRHALPNALAPALVTISFGIANAILIESSLSFLGVGVPQGVITWGSLLNDARGHYEAWWMTIFPGLMIFITVTAYNLIGEGLRDALDPKLKR